MAKPEDCREYAKRCLEMANNFADEKLQSMLFDMAHEWNKVAADLELNAALRAKFEDVPINPT
jgi:hypothetical protein